MKIQNLKKIHLWIGCLFSLPIVWLGITGILLNHPEQFGLYQPVRNLSVLSYYFGEAPKNFKSYPCENTLVTEFGGSLSIDDQLSTLEVEKFIGATSIQFLDQNFILIASQNKLFLLNSQGEEVDRIPLNFKCQNIGIHNHQLALKSIDQKIYLADSELEKWTPTEQQNINWIQPIPAPDKLKKSLTLNWYGDELHWQRVVRDLHMFGPIKSFGTFLLDLSGLALIFLPFSGLYLAYRLRKKSRS